MEILIYLNEFFNLGEPFFFQSRNTPGNGINFAFYRLGGGTSMTIRSNTILDFGDIGIYDDAKAQNVIVEYNTIWDRRDPFVSRYGIRTDYTANRWTIRYNQVYAGSISPISAPSSTLIGNTDTSP